MANPCVPSSRQFVVHGPEGANDRIARQLPEHAATTTSPDTQSVIVELDDEDKDPRVSWRKLIDDVKDAEWVSPLMFDRDDQPHVPTGEITVRFGQHPSDEDLAAFAKTHGLRLARRNEFVSEQAVFRPRNARETYIPDLVDQICGDSSVASAWQSTKSAYRRI
jgi:hypothetical protein